MNSTRSMIRAAAVSAAVVAILAAACDSPEQGDRALASDAGAQAILRKASQASARSVALTKEDVDSLTALKDKYPNSPTVRSALVSALVTRGDLELAENVIREQGEASLSDTDKRNLAKIYVKSGRFADATVVLEPLIAANPSELELRALAGLSYLRTGQLDDSARNLDAVWDEILSKRMVSEISLRGMVHYRKNELDKARETLEKAANIDPEHITTLNALSQVYQALGDEDKAEGFRKKVFDLQDRLLSKSLEGSKIVEKKIALEQAWKSNQYQEVSELAKELLPGSSGRERAVLLEYLFQSYKKLGMEKEAAEVLALARGNSDQ